MRPRNLVDLQLASTYLPACVSLAKSTVLILTVAHIHADDQRVAATLLLLCIPLYVDRLVTQERIFDCNSMLCTLHASYMVNAIRHVLGRGMFLAAAVDAGAYGASVPDGVSADRLNGSTAAAAQGMLQQHRAPEHYPLRPSMSRFRRHYHIDWEYVSASEAIEDSSVASVLINSSWCILWFLSMFLLVDRDMLHLRTRSVVHQTTKVVAVIQSFALGVYVQTPLFEVDKPSTPELIVRSYIFVILCIVWSYAVGVRHMVTYLSTCTRMQSITVLHTKHGKISTETSIVQTFYQCQARFVVVLFLGR